MNDLIQRVLDNLQTCDFSIKALALDALDIKVYTSSNTIKIEGVIPLELALPTIAQTSACL